MRALRKILGRSLSLLSSVIIAMSVIAPAHSAPVQELNKALYEASEKGALDEVRKLLDMGAEVDAKGLFGGTPLMRAASSGHVRVVEELISRGADVNKRSWQGATALMDAALWSHDVGVLAALLDGGAKVDALDKEGFTALMAAAGRGRLDMVELLVKRGANVNAINVRGLNALGVAAEKNRGAVVDFLRKRGAKYDIHSAAAVGDIEELGRYASTGGDIDAREKEYGRSLLWMAASNGHADVVGWLVGKGADLEARGPNGHTPLHAASEYGRNEVVTLLLDKGANIEAVSEGMGGSALHVASLFGRAGTVGLLLSRGCHIEARTKAQGETALMLASESGAQDVVRMLLRKGAEADARDRKKETALMKAASRVNVETVRALLAAEASVNLKEDELGRAALHFACCSEQCAPETVLVAELLISKGADIFQADSEGYTPLDCAAGNGCVGLTKALIRSKPDVQLPKGRLEKALLFCASEGNFNEKIVTILLHAGASVNCADPDGYTPLMRATESGALEAVRFLLSNGADPSLKNSQGASATDIAAESGQQNIVELLRPKPGE